MPFHSAARTALAITGAWQTWLLLTYGWSTRWCACAITTQGDFYRTLPDPVVEVMIYSTYPAAWIAAYLPVVTLPASVDGFGYVQAWSPVIAMAAVNLVVVAGMLLAVREAVLLLRPDLTHRSSPNSMP
jgi:hypothetical protein